MPVRRAADPLNVQDVWDAIKYAGHQKQMADLARLTKFIQKFSGCAPAQAEMYIKQTLDDGLILDLKKIANKGSNIGTEVESYKINREQENDFKTPLDDGHDWYCIECHLAGDVNLCRNCYRVFHRECSTKAQQRQTLFPKRNHINSDPNNTEKKKSNNGIRDYIYDENLCSICNLAAIDIDSGLTREEMNRLLNFVLCRIKSWVPDILTSTLSTEPKHEWHTPAELGWRAMQLFYQHMDMGAVELKIRTKEYETFTQFQADVHTMLHNVAIFHGVDSQEYGAAELMLRDMKYDLSELQNCVDCYRHSNEKLNTKWFCFPCRIPHKLVWAKQKGYPYWPAKVIRETDSSCDVRFFGGKYERSILPKACIKPINTPTSQLQIKRSASFNKAVEELHYHQKLLENPTELTKILSVSPKKINKTPRKTKSVDSPEDIFEFREMDVDTKVRKVGRPKRKSFYAEVTPPPKKKIPTPVKQSPKVNNDIIHISDAEEDRDTFNVTSENCDFSDYGQEQVTSSTELIREDNFNSRESGDGIMQKLEQPYSDAVEKMRRKLEQCKDKKSLILMAMDCMQSETDRITNEHNETLKKLFDVHNKEISETKKKQWCFNCEQDAIYHCCWNTAYCSPTCQQQHWQAEHKKVCRRKR